MSRFTDQQYLKTDQYKDSTNLDARVEIHRRFSTNTYGWFNWFFDRLLKLPEDARILELGWALATCGRNARVESLRAGISPSVTYRQACWMRHGEILS